MVESIWRYPLKSAQGEALPRVFIGPDGPAGDRAWACLSADGMIVSAKHPRRWGRMLYVLAMLMAPGRGGGVLICVPGAEPLRAGTAAADDALSAWLGERVRLTAEVPAQARLHRLWPAEPGMIPEWAAAPEPGTRSSARSAGPCPAAGSLTSGRSTWSRPARLPSWNGTGSRPTSGGSAEPGPRPGPGAGPR